MKKGSSSASNSCWNESEVVNYLQRLVKKHSFHPVVLPNGDDAYAYPVRSRRPQLITTDAMVEQVHWKAKWATPEDLAYKLVAVNLSDMAAMGGQSERAFLTMALPKAMPQQFVRRFLSALSKRLQQEHIDLCGGDTSASTKTMMLSLTLQGTGTHGKLPSRSAAQPGDLIFITGDLGAAAAGRFILDKPYFDSDWREALIQRFWRPEARLEESRMLVRSKKIHAMMDCSDGLAADCWRLAEASQVGAVIYAANLPVAIPTRMAAQRYKQDLLAWVLGGGEDYELLVTCPARYAVDLVTLFQQQAKIPIALIGEVTTKNRGIKLQTAQGVFTDMPKGFQHQG